MEGEEQEGSELPETPVVEKFTVSTEEISRPSSPFERMFSSISDPDELAASLTRAYELMPEEARAKLPWVKARTEQEKSVISETETKRKQSLTNISQRRSMIARNKITQHLVDIRSKLLDPETSEESDYDPELINQSLEEFAQSESAIRHQEFIANVSSTVVDLIEKVGEPLNEDQLMEIIKKTDGTWFGILGGYLEEYGNRRETSGIEKGRGEAKSSDEQWRDSELAAMRAEILGKNSPGEPSIDGVSQFDEEEGTGSSRMLSSEEKIKLGIRKSRKKSRGKV